MVSDNEYRRVAVSYMDRGYAFRSGKDPRPFWWHESRIARTRLERIMAGTYDQMNGARMAERLSEALGISKAEAAKLVKGLRNGDKTITFDLERE
jgi:hypothetical protein